MINFTKPTTTQAEFRDAMRWSNKLLKSWFTENMPLPASRIIAQAMLSYETFVKTINQLKGSHKKAILADVGDLLAALKLDDAKINDQDSSSAIQKQIDQVIEEHKLKKTLYEYALNLYMDEKSDTDLTINPANFMVKQKEACSTITQALQNVNQLQEDDVEALFMFCNNIFIVMQQMRLQKMNKQKVEMLLPWLRLGLHMIEVGEVLAPKKSQTTIELWFSKIGTERLLDISIVNYFELSVVVAYQAENDMDLLMAENYMQTAEKLYVKYKVMPTFTSLPEIVITRIDNLITSLHAFINLKNNDVQAFKDNIQKIRPYDNYSSFQVDVFVLAGDYFRTLDPTASFDYYLKAQDMLKVNFQNQVSVIVLHDTNERLKEVERKIVEQRTIRLNVQREALQKQFPNLKIAPHPTNSSLLLLFLKMKNIPANAANIFERQKAQCLKFEKAFDKPMGIQFTTKKLDAVQTVNEMAAFICALEAVQVKPVKTSAPLQPVPMSQTSPIALPEAPKAKQVVKLIEQPTESYERPLERVKEKTHKAPASIPIPLSITTAADTTCHAADFGFKEASNPLVTPVYCSLAAQKNRRAKLFVSFKGIEGVDKDVEDLFKGMLNPHPEGILTVAMVNQAGPKLWKDPNKLGDAWNLCALRFKRKGAAGWLRVLTEPVEKVVVVNDQGKEESRYLFSLGKPVHK